MQKSLIDDSDLDPKTSHSQSIGVLIYSLTQPGLLVIVIPVLTKGGRWRFPPYQHLTLHTQKLCECIFSSLDSCWPAFQGVLEPGFNGFGKGIVDDELD
jgi:hypothetical protein